MSQVPPPPPPAAPPPPPSDRPIGGSAAPFNVGDAVSYGWNAFWKNVGPMILIVLAIWAVNIVLSLIGLATGNAVLRLFFNLVGWIVGLLLALGLIRATLAVTRGETPEVSMLFETDNFGPYLVAAILFGIGAFVGLLLCIIPGIIFITFFGFYGYVIVDRNEQSPTEALKKSSELVKGHFGAVIGLAIVLFLINVVGALLCGVGLLFTAGITAIAWAYAYRALSGEPVAPVV
jgi:uncharacterized membrane protein